MKKIEKMASFLKQAFEKEKICEEDFLITNIKNQNTHYPITNFEIKDNHEFNQIIEIIKNNSNENILIKDKGLCKDNRRGIVLATVINLKGVKNNGWIRKNTIYYKSLGIFKFRTNCFVIK